MEKCPAQLKLPTNIAYTGTWEKAVKTWHVHQNKSKFGTLDIIIGYCIMTNHCLKRKKYDTSLVLGLTTMLIIRRRRCNSMDTPTSVYNTPLNCLARFIPKEGYRPSYRFSVKKTYPEVTSTDKMKAIYHHIDSRRIFSK